MGLALVLKRGLKPKGLGGVSDLVTSVSRLDGSFGISLDSSTGLAGGVTPALKRGLNPRGLVFSADSADGSSDLGVSF